MFLAVMVLGLITAFLVFVPAKLNKYFDKTPKYVEAISNSSKFKEPVTVRVNRQELPTDPLAAGNRLGGFPWDEKKPGSAVAAASVLESAGLIRMSVSTTYHTVQMPTTDATIQIDPVTGRMSGSPTRENYRDVKSDTLLIQLTEKGRQDSVNWQETDEPYQTGNSQGPTLGWWRVPIGGRQLIRIESVAPYPEESGSETILVTFRWRWQPNQLGESFDCVNTHLSGQAAKVQEAVRSLGWNSQAEYDATAKLRKVGGLWEVNEITFAKEDFAKILGS